jgi:hypothetical protein
VKGIGEEGEMVLGPFKFEKGCKGELHAKGTVPTGEFEVLPLTVKFKECETSRSLGKGLTEPVSVSFTLGMEFHSNGFVKIGPARVPLKLTKSTCELNIPPQYVPAGAEKNGEKKEFEATSYSTEKEKLTSKGSIKKYGEFRERLDIEWELKAIKVDAKVTPSCQFSGGTINPETKEAEFGGGKMEGELEEVTLKGGNLSFIPAI